MRKPAPCPASSVQVPRVAEREGARGAPCLGVALVVSGALWLSVSTLLFLAA